MLEKMSFQNSARLQLLLAIVLVISQIGNCEERRNKNFAASLCGCHELQSLQEIRQGNWTPNATATLIGTFQLREFEENISECAQLCGRTNVNSSHLIIVGLTCECYSDLKTFHCEEEEGEPLANVYCIERKTNLDLDVEGEGEEKKELGFSWREPLDLLPSFDSMSNMETSNLLPTTLSVASNLTEENNDDDIVTASTNSLETSAILVGVLLVAAVLILMGMSIRTCIDVRRQKTTEMKKRLQESSEVFTSISIA